MTKGIYKRGNVYWVRYAGLDGKIVFESAGTSKFRDAEDLLLKRKQAIKEGKQPEVKKIANFTFNQLAVEYTEWAQRQRAYKQKAYVVQQLKDVFGKLPLRQINTITLEHYQTDKVQKGNKPATVNRHLATIKHMFTKAVEWDMVEEDTLKRVRRVKLLEENNRRLRYLSTEDCQNLVKACTQHLRPIVITALNTGMRKSEILNLEWEKNIDLRHGFILLTRTKNGERREIPINETLKDTLQGLVRRLDSPYVFFVPNSGKSYVDIRDSFARACRKAVIKDFHFHDLRHTFASHLVMAGIDITTVKELLGHKTLTMTLRYAHLAPSHKVNALSVLDKTLNERPSIQKLDNVEVI
jgi:integrase